jgi:hypothetical protein
MAGTRLDKPGHDNTIISRVLLPEPTTDKDADATALSLASRFWDQIRRG